MDVFRRRRQGRVGKAAGLLLLLVFFIYGGRGYFYFFIDRAERILYGVKPGVTLAGKQLCGYKINEVWLYVMDEAVAMNIPPQNATIDRNSGEVIPERDGRRVDVGATVEIVMAAVKGEAVDFVIHTDPAEYDRFLLAGITETIGSYLTYIPGSEARASNIALAAAAINNTLVYPGKIFSFNRTVGPRNRRKATNLLP